MADLDIYVYTPRASFLGAGACDALDRSPMANWGVQARPVSYQAERRAGPKAGSVPSAGATGQELAFALLGLAFGVISAAWMVASLATRRKARERG